MITNPRFASIWASDQDKALDFWVGKVGFTVQEDTPYGDSGARWIELKPPSGTVYIVLPPPNPEEQQRLAGFSPVWFDCDDLDETYEDLASKGVDFPVTPQEAPWDPSTRWAQFADPDGNLYGLSQRS